MPGLVFTMSAAACSGVAASCSAVAIASPKLGIRPCDGEGSRVAPDDSKSSHITVRSIALSVVSSSCTCAGPIVPPLGSRAALAAAQSPSQPLREVGRRLRQQYFLEDGVSLAADALGDGLRADSESVGHLAERGSLRNLEVPLGDGGDECLLLLVGDAEAVGTRFALRKDVGVFDIEPDGLVLTVAVELGERRVVVESEAEQSRVVAAGLGNRCLVVDENSGQTRRGLPPIDLTQYSAFDTGDGRQIVGGPVISDDALQLGADAVRCGGDPPETEVL